MRVLLTIAWMLGSLWWLSEDQVIRDGDEEGHVGAAELMRLHLEGGQYGAFAWDTWRGDLGEYPPVYPALVGAWWWLAGSGLPGVTPVRAVNLLGLLLAAWATAQLAQRLCPPDNGARKKRWSVATAASVTAFAVVLTLPLANGLARHFMPEGLLVGWVALSVYAAARAADRGDTNSTIFLGTVLGAGLLIKQTFLPLAILPVMVAGMGLRSGWLGVLILTGSIAGPWYWSHLADQTNYISSSIQAGPQFSQAAHLGYYPATMLHLVGGPVAVVAAVTGGLLAGRRGQAPMRRGLAIALAWLLGLVILAVIPKKYPRLAAPLAPALGLLAGLGAACTRRRDLFPVATVLCGTGWLVWSSVSPPTDPTWVPRVDGKCPQRWLRPPNPDDLGLAVLAKTLASASPGPLAVDGAPEIPCSIQTTHPWINHLDPYLRRAGIERPVVPGTAPDAAVQATFLPLTEATPNDVVLPSLDLVLRLQAR
ncbi:MAG TPA: hypothetical protein DFR83_23075 [Deltaproteobacteria bacterium]|nr:hypothetical protein [Deltaproteobacteria bacterium]